MRFLMICLAFLFAGGAAHAESVSIYGLGGHSCGDYIAATKGLGPGQVHSLNHRGETYYSHNASFNQWTLGFLSASNMQTGANINVDLAGADQWLRNWCTKNPTANFAAALAAFVKAERK